MALKLIREVDLSSLDADPLTQPAADALGPLVTAKGGRVLVQAWLVDAAGKPIDPAGLTVSLVVATWSRADDGAEGWGRGAISTGVVPGEWQTQSELGSVVGFQVAVTASSGAGTLRIYAEQGPRGDVP